MKNRGWPEPLIRPRRTPLWYWPVVAVVGCLLLVLAVALVARPPRSPEARGSAQDAPAATAPALAGRLKGGTPESPATYTREEFRQLVAGRTTRELTELLGKPDRTQDYASGVVGWEYLPAKSPRPWRVVDAVTGKGHYEIDITVDPRSGRVGDYPVQFSSL